MLPAILLGDTINKRTQGDYENKVVSSTNKVINELHILSTINKTNITTHNSYTLRIFLFTIIRAVCNHFIHLIYNYNAANTIKKLQFKNTLYTVTKTIIICEAKSHITHFNDSKIHFHNNVSLQNEHFNSYW